MIYIVTVGQYDDYEICGVFTSKVEAEEMRDSVANYDDTFWKDVKVEEWKDGETANIWNERFRT
jgi:hypothetical protein